MPVPGTTSSTNHAEEADCCVVDRSCRTPPPLFLNRPLNQPGERLWSRHWQCSPWSANRFLRGSGARREGGHAQPARSNGLTAARLTTAEKEPEPRQQLVAIRAQRTRAGVVTSRIQSRMSGSDGTTVRRVTHWWPRSNAPRGPARPASDGPLPGRRRHRDRAERARAFFPPPAKPPNRFTARCRHRPQIARRTDLSSPAIRHDAVHRRDRSDRWSRSTRSPSGADLAVLGLDEAVDPEGGEAGPDGDQQQDAVRLLDEQVQGRVQAP
jgi:hypothetical protein